MFCRYVFVVVSQYTHLTIPLGANTLTTGPQWKEESYDISATYINLKIYDPNSAVKKSTQR